MGKAGPLVRPRSPSPILNTRTGQYEPGFAHISWAEMILGVSGAISAQSRALALGREVQSAEVLDFYIQIPQMRVCAVVSAQTRLPQIVRSA